MMTSVDELSEEATCKRQLISKERISQQISGSWRADYKKPVKANYFGLANERFVCSI